jgi:hypothetical protein
VSRSMSPILSFLQFRLAGTSCLPSASCPIAVPFHHCLAQSRLVDIAVPFRSSISPSSLSLIQSGPVPSLFVLPNTFRYTSSSPIPSPIPSPKPYPPSFALKSRYEYAREIPNARHDERLAFLILFLRLWAGRKGLAVLAGLRRRRREERRRQILGRRCAGTSGSGVADSGSGLSEQGRWPLAWAGLSRWLAEREWGDR